MAPLSPRQFKGYELRHNPGYVYHSVAAYDKNPRTPSGSVGELNWEAGGKHQVSWIGVEPDHRGKGLATAMWDYARQARPKPHHSPDRTNAGEGFARATGASMPRNLDPAITARYRNA